jgi:hypothetical protein
MAVTTGRPDLAAYNESVAMSTAELVAALRSLLGAKLVAYIGGVKETRAVRQWAEGSRKIANPTDVERLRVAYRAARMINLKDNIQIVQTWFQGLNPFLDDVSPARLLRDGDVDTDGPRVIAAARQYVAVG